jgi:hypothetical protein
VVVQGYVLGGKTGFVSTIEVPPAWLVVSYSLALTTGALQEKLPRSPPSVSSGRIAFEKGDDKLFARCLM